MTIDLSLVIPAYNEAARLEAGYERLAPTLDVLGPSRVEIIVVDDGSNDDTLARAHQVYGHLEHARFVQQPHNLGKGAALRLGIGLAKAPFVVTTDADMAINPVYLPAFATALGSHAFVPGTRGLGGHTRYDSRLRTVASAAFSRLVRHYTKTTLFDTQCGCKGYQLATGRLPRVDRHA